MQPVTAPDLASTIFLPPTDTVAVWQERDALRTTVDWHEMMFAEHAVAFTVAKVAQLDLLNSIRASLDKVIREGGTFEMWKADIVPQLQRAGWWGVVTDPALTGTSEPVVVNDARLRTIFRTNLRMSQAGGLWRRIQRDKGFAPYLRYLSHHYRKHPRKDHYSWHGLVLEVDDPAWQWMFPPNGWGCKCHVQQLTERSLKANGYTVGKAPVPRMVDFKTANGIEKVHQGVDPGFGYNPGFAHLQALSDKLTRSIEQALDVGNDVAASATLRSIVADPAFDQFMGVPYNEKTKLPDTRFPVAILSEQQRDLIGGSSRIVALKPRVINKQAGKSSSGNRGHTDLTIDDYRNLPDIVDQAIIILQQGPTKLIFFSDRRQPDRLWKAIVRQDEGEAYPLVISFHRADLRDARRESGQPDTAVILDQESRL